AGGPGQVARAHAETLLRAPAADLNESVSRRPPAVGSISRVGLGALRQQVALTHLSVGAARGSRLVPEWGQVFPDGGERESQWHRSPEQFQLDDNGVCRGVDAIDGPLEPSERTRGDEDMRTNMDPE